MTTGDTFRRTDRTDAPLYLARYADVVTAGS